jgi:hypothetical protein
MEDSQQIGRASGSLGTMTTHDSCSADIEPAVEQSALWAEVATRLWRYARSIGLSADDGYDAAQEAVARAIATSVPFTDAEDLLRWCQRVVRNLAIDAARRRRWVEDGPAPDRADPRCALRDLEARILLERVLAELRRLPQAQREAIVHHATGVTPPSDRREQNRQSKARERGRATLRSALGGPLAIATGIAAALHGLARRSALVTGTYAGLAVATLLAIVVSVPSSRAHAPAPHRIAARDEGDVERLVTRSVGSSAQPPRSVRTAARAGRPRVPARSTLVVRHAPLDVRAGAERREAGPGDHLVCVGGGPLQEPVCLL